MMSLGLDIPKHQPTVVVAHGEKNKHFNSKRIITSSIKSFSLKTKMNSKTPKHCNMAELFQSIPLCEQLFVAVK